MRAGRKCSRGTALNAATTVSVVSSLAVSASGPAMIVTTPAYCWSSGSTMGSGTFLEVDQVDGTTCIALADCEFGP
jgi:hypothetical protein